MDFSDAEMGMSPERDPASSAASSDDGRPRDGVGEVEFTPLGRGEHLLAVTTDIPRDRAQVFEFFADARNLERITPSFLSFRIETPQPIEMEWGTTIDYRLRLNRVPLRWRTEITEWNPPKAFTDTQVRGPYHTWVHRHSFEEGDGGTAMTDQVRFRLPGWPVGDVALPFVRRRLRAIFEFRGRKIRELLSEG